MVVTTWELHFAAPGSPDVLVDLGDLKSQFTGLRIDWIDDGDTLSVMVGDVEVFKAVILKLQWCALLSVTCSFDKDEQIGGRMVLDDEYEENSVVSISPWPKAPDTK